MTENKAGEAEGFSRAGGAALINGPPELTSYDSTVPNTNPQ